MRAPTKHTSDRSVYAVTAVAVGVSVVHYVDNVVNYDAYPSGDALGLPPPPVGVIAASWFAFSAVALFAIISLRQGRRRRAGTLLAAYSASGLVGIGHYLVEGAVHMAWWRQLHVCVDIACGAALVYVAVSLLRSPAPT